MVTRSMEIAAPPPVKMDTNNSTGDKSSPKPKDIGREFLRQYYTMLSTQPSVLHRFYSNESEFMHGKMDQPVRGQNNIQQAIEHLGFVDCHAKIHRIDCSETLSKGLVMQVAGELSYQGQPGRRFIQSFVLCPQGQKKYYVHNDIFAYVDELFSDSPPTSEREALPQTQHPTEDSDCRVYQPVARENRVSGGFPNGTAHGEESMVYAQPTAPPPVAPSMPATSGSAFESAPLPPRMPPAERMPPSDGMEAPTDPSHESAPLVLSQATGPAPPAEPRPQREPEGGGGPRSWASVALGKGPAPLMVGTEQPPPVPQTMALSPEQQPLEVSPPAPPVTQHPVAPEPVPPRGNVGGGPPPIVLAGKKDLFIGGLPLPIEGNLPAYQQIELEMKDFMETNFGKVQSVRCPVRKEAQKAAFAFVSFETLEAAEKLVAAVKPNTKNNIELTLPYAGPTPVNGYVDLIKNADSRAAYGMGGGGRGYGGGGMGGGPRGDVTYYPRRGDQQRAGNFGGPPRGGGGVGAYRGRGSGGGRGGGQGSQGRGGNFSGGGGTPRQ